GVDVGSMAAPAGRRAIVVDPLTAAPVSAIVAATGFDVAAETAVVADALVLAELHRPDVVLVAQDAVGFESDTIPRLRHASEGLVVLVTTDGAAVARAHDSGAVEVVHRMQMLDLEPALRRVARRLDEEGTG